MEKKKITKSQALARIGECIAQGKLLLSHCSEDDFRKWTSFCENSLEHIFDKGVSEKFGKQIQKYITAVGYSSESPHKADVPTLLAFLNDREKDISELYEDDIPVARRMVARPVRRIRKEDDSVMGMILAMFLTGTLGFLISESGKEEDLLQKCNISRQDVKRRLNEIAKYQSNLEKIRHAKLWPQIVEALHLYVFGFMKASAFFSAAVLEKLLKEELGCSDKFQDLIKKAEENKIITPKEASYINGVRLDRNEVGHESAEITEGDALMIINITIRVFVRKATQGKPEQSSV